jgi:4-phospho-D-threonate 3-dehydrogenase / 4-phospho-D-erythronate 3-dehydrogenase
MVPDLMSLPIIAVTMGDPAGIGPEICLSLLAHPSIREICRPVVFGDAALLVRCARESGRPAPQRIIAMFDWPQAAATLDGPAVLDLHGFDQGGFTPGTVSAATGAAAYSYVEKSIAAALAGEVAAVTTAPLNKEALHAAGIHFPGHTEIFAERTGAKRSCMSFFSDELSCSLVTVHIGYQDVPAHLTTQRILDVIELTADAVRRIRGRAPRLAVCGLNPHAGEHGLFGRNEEERIILPAIEAARKNGLDVTGPLPPDTAFIAPRRRGTDAFICMYHDQALIPLKALAFDSAVNTTLGLPIVRTSVDHGTACDIAWQGKADPGSLFEAVKLAVKLARPAGA